MAKERAESIAIASRERVRAEKERVVAAAAAAKERADEDARAELERRKKAHDDLLAQCANEVAPIALERFTAGLITVPPDGDDNFLPTLWGLHRDTLVESFRALVHDDILLVPLTESEGGQYGVKPPTLTSNKWWTQLIADEANACGMATEAFGRGMAGGFAHMLNISIRKNNASVGRSPSFHQYASMPSEQRERLDQSKADLQLEIVIGRYFATAYGNEYDPVLKRDMETYWLR